MYQSESSSDDSSQDICNAIPDLYLNPVSQNPNDSRPASPSIKSEHEPDEVATSPKTPPPFEVPVEIHAPRLEPEDLKRKTPKSTDPNHCSGSLEVTTVLSSRKNSSNEDKMYGRSSLPEICTLCGEECFIGISSYRSTSSPATSSASCSSSQKCTASTLVCSPSGIFSTQEPGLDNGSSDSGKNNSNSAGTPNLSDSENGSCSPHSFTTEDSESHERPDSSSSIETLIDHMQLSSSASDPSESQNVPYVLECAVVPAGPARVTFLDTNVQYPCFTDMSQCRHYVPTLRVDLTIPPTMPTHVPQLTHPPAMQFPEAPAPLHSRNRSSSFPRSQHHFSRIPPSQSVSSASTLQYPPPPLHIPRPELVYNPVPQFSSSTTRLPPVTEAFYPPDMGQVSKPTRPSHPSNTHCLPLSQNASRPSFHTGFYLPSQTTHSTVRQNSSHPTVQNPQNVAQVSQPTRTSYSSNPHYSPLSQNASRPSFHTSFYAPSQTTHSTVQQNSSYPTFQNVCRHGVQATHYPVQHPTFQTARGHGIQNTVYYHSQSYLMLQSHLVAVMPCPAAHGDYQGYSNPVNPYDHNVYSHLY